MEMKLQKLLSKIEYKAIGDLDPNFNVEELCHDSRRTHENAVFVCIKGALSDGHDYIGSAYSRGCRYFITEKEVDLPPDACILITLDTRKALSLMSAEFFENPADELTVIGITGTKGKTTTSLMIYEILNKCGKSCGYIGSNGVDFGKFHYETANTTPESYDLQMYMREMVLAGVKYLVMEVSSQALYLHRVHGIKFDICIYTNLSVDHIGGHEHPTFEHYKECKRTLFSDYGADTVIYNADDEYASEMISNVKNAKTVSYSICNIADYFATDITSYKKDDALGIEFSINSSKKRYKGRLCFPGKFSVYNALSAVSACVECGIDIDVIANTLEKIRIKGRFELVKALPYAMFIIDYAHNEVSLTSALNALREYSPTRLICLFGSVGGRTQGRRAEMGRVASRLADFSIITSDNPDFEDPESIMSDIESQFDDKDKYIKISDRKEAIAYAVRIARKGDVFLFAGKGHENYQLILGKKIPFSEKEILENLSLTLTE